MTMQKITATSPDAQSADLIANNIDKLNEMFPELVTEGPDGAALNVDVLKALVGDKTLSDSDEKYGLSWHGKRRARQLALTPSTGTLRPCPEESVDWENTQNLMIEGDNLEVLKLLQKSYAGKVKLIYIDPPYNTGKDFVYPDNFQDNIKNYLEMTGQVEGAQKISSNTEASGRFHTDWLNMMYPRLKLARNLMRDDGVVVIHIDENEYPNLEKMLEEIFGEENNLGTIVWDKRNPKGEVVGIAQQHELLSVFCKRKESFAGANYFTRKKENAESMISKVEALVRVKGGVTEEVRGLFSDWIKNRKDDLSGGERAYCFIDDNGEIYQPVSMAAPDKPETRSHRALIHPVTQKKCPVPAKGWRYPDATMDELINKGLVLFGEDESTQPRRKYLLRENIRENFPSLLYFGGNSDVLGVPFDNPKPLPVVTRFIEPLHEEADIVLDFFAGSGTTGHAVMAQNAIDGIARRYILVQLPERLDPDNKEQRAAAAFCDQVGKPRTIAGLTNERLKRAAAQVKEDNSMFSGDTGFRVFKLDQSNIRSWAANSENIVATLLDNQNHLLEGRTEADVLYELLLKLGLDLCVPIEKKTISGKEVSSVGGGVLMACLAEHIANNQVDDLAQGIVDWHKELAPAGDTTFVFRDSAFADDVAKTNMAAILEQHGIQNVRSL